MKKIMNKIMNKKLLETIEYLFIIGVIITSVIAFFINNYIGLYINIGCFVVFLIYCILTRDKGGTNG